MIYYQLKRSASSTGYIYQVSLSFFLLFFSIITGDIFKALERGVDVFDSSYAMKATEKGCALSYPVKLQESNTNKFPDKAEPCAAEPCATEPVRIFEIDLKDPKYKMSMEPLVSDCTCYTCTNYSCAYVHHLLDTKELLANILLMV